MSDRQETVRAILDEARAKGLTALTAPQCKVVCDAYGISGASRGARAFGRWRPARSPAGSVTRWS